ncbi:MAG: hypothetical protein MUE85_10380 [Microscillaceae bacterium]|jgi:hypothetical protein|nr:hypothetical protein [Microscillaceae bacterium]
MLTDYWVLVQLLTQLCAWVLICGAVGFALNLLWGWQSDSNSELQIRLERQSYLISSLVQFVLIFQIFSLLIFLQIANFHIPHLIRGAMCATGALGVNEFGYPILYLKMGGVLVYAIFLIINYLDNLSPHYPLTPGKYWLVFPAFGLISADLGSEIFYFAQIKPDIIATCCSVNFLEQNSQSIDNEVINSNNQTLLIYGFYGTGIGLLGLFVGNITIFKKNNYLIISQLMLGIIFVGLAVLALKYFFVKYIYGVPNHNCLFDIFFAQYYYIGYVLFFLYYALVFTLLFGALVFIFRFKIPVFPSTFWVRLQWLGLALVWACLLIPSLYWGLWQGNL